MMDERYDLNANQTPYPYSWFSVDIKLGCLTVHLDEDNWHKCVVSEMLTNIQLMLSMHNMDQGSSINYDIEEKQINLGLKLVEQELLKYHEDLNFYRQESLVDQLYSNQADFKVLYSHHYEEIEQVIRQIEKAQQESQRQDSSSLLMAQQQTAGGTEPQTDFSRTGTSSQQPFEQADGRGDLQGGADDASSQARPQHASSTSN